MRIVFMGTPKLAADILDALASEHDVVGVFTRADAIRGRGNKPSPSPVAEVADQRNIPLFKPERFDDEAVDALKEFEPEAVCVVAYGMLLPEAALQVAPHGCLNVHASLLPRWRGAAPLERALLAGDEYAGVSIMKMEAGLDTGAYCNQKRIPLENASAEWLQGEVARTGAEALLETIAVLEDGGDLAWIEQDENLVTYAAKIEKGELDLDPRVSSSENALKVRASSDAHPSRAEIAGRVCTVLEAQDASEAVSEAMGERSAGDVVWSAKRLYLVCSDGALEVLSVKPQGKKAMDAKAFAAGIQNIKDGSYKWGRL